MFTTIESTDLALSLRVGKIDTPTTEPFQRDRLFVSLLQALGHRSNALEAAGFITDTVTAKLLKTHPGARVEVTALRNTAYNTLQSFDTVAATTYAAYHPN